MEKPLGTNQNKSLGFAREPCSPGEAENVNMCECENVRMKVVINSCENVRMCESEAHNVKM
jgi:hypothetical protein